LCAELQTCNCRIKWGFAHLSKIQIKEIKNNVNAQKSQLQLNAAAENELLCTWSDAFFSCEFPAVGMTHRNTSQARISHEMLSQKKTLSLRD